MDLMKNGEFNELNRLINDDLPGHEFWLGGEVVRQMSEEIKKKLEDKKVKLRDNPKLFWMMSLNSF